MAKTIHFVLLFYFKSRSNFINPERHIDLHLLRDVCVQCERNPSWVSKIYALETKYGQTSGILKLTRKGVPGFRGPALVCLNAIDKKSVYWSSSCARILNVQERTKETSSNISSTCIPFTTIAGAGQHSFNTCLRCTSYL